MQAVPVQKIKKLDRKKLLLLKGVKLHGGQLEKLKSELTKLLGRLPYMGQASQAYLSANSLGNSNKMGKSHLKLRSE